MKKLLGLLIVGMGLAVMSGCNQNPISAPRISIDEIGTIAVGTNTITKNVTGKIDADTAIESITATITTSAGATVPSTQIDLSTPAANGKNSQDLTATSGIVLSIKSAALAGDYKLNITVNAGESVTASFDFKLTKTTPSRDIDSATVQIGSYDNPSIGSSIDLDAASPSAIIASDAVKSGSGVDLIGTYSTKNGGAYRIFNPVYARDSSGITVFATWPDAATTSFVRVSGTAWASIITKAQIQALYTNGTSITSASITAAQVTSGDNIFVVKTSSNAYVAIEIASFEAAVTGTANIKWGK